MGRARSFGTGGVRRVEGFYAGSFERDCAIADRIGELDATMRPTEAFRNPMPADGERVAAVFQQMNGRTNAARFSRFDQAENDAEGERFEPDARL